jgi:hypothetical protein
MKLEEVEGAVEVTTQLVVALGEQVKNVTEALTTLVTEAAESTAVEGNKWT